MDTGGRFAALLAGASLAALAAAPAEAHAHAWRFRADGVLGTTLDIAAIAPDRAAALIAAEAARVEIARLDAVLSGWREDSELSELNRTAVMAVSPDLYRVLAACEGWRAASGGAFDARQGEAFARLRLGGAAAPADLPDPVLDSVARTVNRPDGVQFAPDALAKGYIVDAALSAARAAAPGMTGMMIDLGGDLRCWGAGPSGGGWIVGVGDPGERSDNARPAVLVRADGLAMATSGPRDEGFNHLLGSAGVLQATVLAPSAADADALATALAVMPPQAGLDLVERITGAEAWLVHASGETHSSSGWARLTVAAAEPPARLIRAAAQAPAGWPARYALTVNYELPNHGARAYSPYVAVWVTDEASRLVRALTMLGDDLDWVSENYIWWRRYGRARPQVVAAVSRPTRPAGRYSVVWDGKDDAGKPLPQGRYTLHIEATREKGLHSYQTIDLNLGRSPVQATAAADEELGVSNVRYGPR